MIEDIKIDGVELDKDNCEFSLALEYALQTSRSIFLTGKAGTGKTTFLKYLRTTSAKTMVVLAPTGVAAVNAEGQTIHSFFQIAPSIYFPGDQRLSFSYAMAEKSPIFKNFKLSENKINIIRNLQILVIDEISMVRADLLDVVDAILRAYRQIPLPFGGVQLLLIGDMFQLPPVVSEDEHTLFSQFYDSEFFFSSKALQQVAFLYIELKKIYRQSDLTFINLLNRLRVNCLLPSDYDLLHSKLRPGFSQSKDYIYLATTNNKVSEINNQRLRSLATSEIVYKADVTGEFPVRDMPTDEVLRLKVGAQVMFVKNDISHRYYNGKIGTVSKIKKDVVTVEIVNSHGEVSVIDVERDEWSKFRYTWNKYLRTIEKEEIGTFTQFPIRLAWAITVHKSQGLTFEKVIADLSNSFSPGQVYVALSRCVSLDGLILSSEITRKSVLTDPRVVEFAKRELPSSTLLGNLDSNKADYCYSLALDAFRNHNSEKCIDQLLTAIKYRNDTGSDKFVRYIKVWFRRMMTLAERSNHLKTENKLLLKRITTLENNVNNLKKELKNKNKKKQN